VLALLADSDIVISAAGTSAWDFGIIAVPAVFSAVVENQQAGLAAIGDAGVGLGVVAVGQLDALEGIAPLVDGLLADKTARRDLVARGLDTFDDGGVELVADEFERLR